jgi:hypothetical protein
VQGPRRPNPHTLIHSFIHSANRKGLPDALTKKKLKLKKYEIAAYRKDNKMLALAWKDKRNVVMLSTWHNKSTQQLRRKIKNNVEEQFQKPTVKRL